MRRLKNSFWSACLALGGLYATGCGPRPTPPGYAADDVRAFVQKHRVQLEAEVATGSGPRIYDLAILANCQDVPQLGRGLHAAQAQLFESVERLSSSAVVTSSAEGASDAEVADRVARYMEERRELRCLNLDRTRTREFAAGRRHIGPWRGPTSARNGTP